MVSGLGFFIASLIITSYLRKFALKKRVLDIPNERSSHQLPMPRGGGLSFVICILSALVWLIVTSQVTPILGFSIFFALLSVAVVGLWDDLKRLPASWRLVGHFIAAAMILYGIGGVEQWLGLKNELLIIIANMMVGIYLVWVINLFNFMDGIDGLAAMQVLTVSLGGALLFFMEGQTQCNVLIMLVAASVFGFFVWNFPRARIFMGDAGSGFLGLLVGVFSLLAAEVNVTLFYGWIILNAVFFTDATMTLLRRAYLRKNIFSAHCSHAYQHATKYYRKHWVVTLSVALINMIYLLPIAVMVQQQYLSGLLGILLAYLPLSLLVLKFDAGS